MLEEFAVDGTQAPVPVVELEGVRLAGLSESALIGLIVAELARGRGGWACSVNLDILRQCVRDPQLRALVNSAELALVDGMPLLWSARLRGLELPERVPGSSLIRTLPPALARAGRSVFLLGGSPGAAEQAATTLAAASPGLRIAGTLCPPMDFDGGRAPLGPIVAALRASSPDVVFVGLGFPKQDRLIARLRPDFPSSWFLSCGISFSFVAGELRRAPRCVQAAGLEWAHRLCQEPRRLYRRYLLEDLPFAARLGIASVRRRAGRL